MINSCMKYHYCMSKGNVIIVQKKSLKSYIDLEL